MLISLFIGCQNNSDKVAASIDGVNIKLHEIDKVIETKLHSKLNEIYYIRRVALENVIESKLIEREAMSLGISVDSLLKKLNNQIDSTSLSSFAQDNGIDELIPLSSKPGTFLSANSIEGMEYLKHLYSKEIKRIFIDKLKAKYKTEIFISPPKVPKIIIPKEIIKHPLNSTVSKNEIIFVGGLTCQYTKEFYPTLKKILKIHSAKFSFFFTPLTDEISSKDLLIENKSINETNNILDEVFLSTGSLPSTTTDSSDSTVVVKLNSILISINALRELGISSTPVLIINDRIFYGNYTYDEISKYIDAM